MERARPRLPRGDAGRVFARRLSPLASRDEGVRAGARGGVGTGVSEPRERGMKLLPGLRFTWKLRGAVRESRRRQARRRVLTGLAATATAHLGLAVAVETV